MARGTDSRVSICGTVESGANSAVMDGLEKVGYTGYVTFEYFHPYPHYPEALVYQTSDSLDRIIGRK